MAPVGRSRGGARGSGIASRTPGRPRGPALRTLRSVCREPAGPPERVRLRAASAARGQCGGFGPSRKTPRWSAERRGSLRNETRHASQACAGPSQSPAGESPGRLRRSAPLATLRGELPRAGRAARRGDAPACPHSTEHIQETRCRTESRFTDRRRRPSSARRMTATLRRRTTPSSASLQRPGRLLAGVRASRSAGAGTPARATCTPASSGFGALVPEEEKEYLRACIQRGAAHALARRDPPRRHRRPRRVSAISRRGWRRRRSAPRRRRPRVGAAPDARVRRL